MVTVRTASIRDKQEIVQLILRHDSDFTPKLTSRVNVGEYVDKLLSKGVCYVGVDEEKAAAFLSFYANDHSNNVAYLSLILVDRNYRGGDLAHTLMKKMESHCEETDFKTIKLEMALGKLRLKEWYTGMGYRPKTEFCREGYKCLVMEKSIN